MARIRTIKPEFWEDEDVAKLPMQARLMFIGCWNFADDFGMILNSIKYLKSKIFPYDETLREHQVNTWLDAIINARMLIPFDLNDKSYLYIRTFSSHQIIDKRYIKSILPKEVNPSEFIENLLNIKTTTCTHSDHIVTTMQERKGSGKEMEVEEEQECFEVWPSFNDFWELYEKKIGDKIKVKSKWDKLTFEEKNLIMIHVPDYKASQPDKQFRKNPETYLNNKSWNDEIVFRDKPKQGNMQKYGTMLDQLNELTRIQNGQ